MASRGSLEKDDCQDGGKLQAVGAVLRPPVAQLTYYRRHPKCVYGQASWKQMSRHNSKRQRTAGSQPTRAQEDLFRLFRRIVFFAPKFQERRGTKKKGRRGWRGSSREEPDHDLAMCADGGPLPSMYRVCLPRRETILATSRRLWRPFRGDGFLWLGEASKSSSHVLFFASCFFFKLR